MIRASILVIFLALSSGVVAASPEKARLENTAGDAPASIRGLSWETTKLEVLRQGSERFAVLKGRFQRKSHDLIINSNKVRVSSSGVFGVRLPLTGDRTRVTIVITDPGGKSEESEVFIMTGKPEKKTPPQPSKEEVIVLEDRAARIEAIAGQSLTPVEGLEWESIDLEVVEKKNGKMFAIVEGTFQRKQWELQIDSKPVEEDKNGRFRVLVPLGEKGHRMKLVARARGETSSTGEVNIVWVTQLRYEGWNQTSKGFLLWNFEIHGNYLTTGPGEYTLGPGLAFTPHLLSLAVFGRLPLHLIPRISFEFTKEYGGGGVFPLMQIGAEAMIPLGSRFMAAIGTGLLFSLQPAATNVAFFPGIKVGMRPPWKPRGILKRIDRFFVGYDMLLTPRMTHQILVGVGLDFNR